MLDINLLWLLLEELVYKIRVLKNSNAFDFKP